MRTRLAVVGLSGLLLMPLLGMADGGPSKTRQVGLASWYGTHHQGRQTASGGRFPRRHLTAAHQSLRLGTQVQVTNLRTKQQVVVRINNRGPYGAAGIASSTSEVVAKRVGLLEWSTERVEAVVVEHAS
jgi:rare lipoprotein A